MKKNGMNLLRAGVFVLAAVFAFAFAPVSTEDEKYGNANGEWYDATDAQIGIDYRCDNPLSQVCLRSAPQPNAPVVSNGVFVPITLSPM
ncbi:hypothetical protein [Aquiflexum gelatinilyticum]|uniref:hypothetical protein n=1 Tax=Aquiflexum gelatinilyticum TaxID=2961943 RepID=UPI002168EE84|nr:hypothetical protein [Aquiflexum gelatinilyticum]MCS4434217.1 hypothetical protein [Aquiflexum gelatinilyticum]